MAAPSRRRARPAPAFEPVIAVRDLTKRYGDTQVLRGMDLDVQPGELLAVVGPNGAGKTTLVEILEGYRERDGGAVTVLGADPAQPTRQWRARIGIVLQTCQLPPELTVWELVERFAGYYPRPRPVGETLDLVGLGDRHDARAGTLSGGQQRRLDVAMALVGDPDLLFLDEPTTGFDPSARHQAWSVISRLRELGKTILLTTHYMEEAEALADRVAVVVDGRILAAGTPESLGGRDHAPATIRFRRPAGVCAENLPTQSGGPIRVDDDHVEIANADLAYLGELLDWARDRDPNGSTCWRSSRGDCSASSSRCAAFGGRHASSRSGPSGESSHDERRVGLLATVLRLEPLLTTPLRLVRRADSSARWSLNAIVGSARSRRGQPRGFSAHRSAGVADETPRQG